jgi:hypothetical protein
VKMLQIPEGTLSGLVTSYSLTSVGQIDEFLEIIHSCFTIPWSIVLSNIFLFLGCVILQVAYVLGQLQNKAASDALSVVLKNVCEHPMVRHEAAEALGSIAGK